MNLFWLLVVAAIGYVAFKVFLGHATPGAKRTSGKAISRIGSPSPHGSGVPAWLQDRWAMAEAQRGQPDSVFPAWYFDPMTEYQSRRLSDDGRKFSPSMTKGQASDLIGLGEPADESDLEVLRFFKKSIRGANEAKARHEVALLFQVETNRRAWEDRPATARQKEFFRFFSMKPGAGLLKREADKQIADSLKAARANADPLAERWRIYEAILEEFDDADFRDTMDMRKPSATVIRKTVDDLLADGKRWDELDADLVAERLLETQPDLAR